LKRVHPDRLGASKVVAVVRVAVVVAAAGIESRREILFPILYASIDPIKRVVIAVWG